MELLRLLGGSLWLRPYVFVFLAVYLWAAVMRIGWRRTVAFTAIAWAVAWAAESSSIRTGFPFGLYHYVESTRDRELWLGTVPFFDSLSFSFLCYLGWALGVLVWAPLVVGRGDFQVADTRAIRTSWRVALVGAFLTMLLDVVIDPVTLRGERWFLGHLYWYPNGGVHFGVPLSNYAGWFLVALVSLRLFQALDRRVAWSRAGVRHVRWGGLLEPAIYLGIVAFNLAITFWIGETLMGTVGGLLYLTVVVLMGAQLANPMRRASPADEAAHHRDFPASPLGGR